MTYGIEICSEQVQNDFEEDLMLRGHREVIFFKHKASKEWIKKGGRGQKR